MRVFKEWFELPGWPVYEQTLFAIGFLVSKDSPS